MFMKTILWFLNASFIVESPYIFYKYIVTYIYFFDRRNAISVIVKVHYKIKWAWIVYTTYKKEILKYILKAN